MEGYGRWGDLKQKKKKGGGGEVNISKIIMMQIPVQPNYSVKSARSIFHSQTARRRAGGTIGRYAASSLTVKNTFYVFAVLEATDHHAGYG